MITHLLIMGDFNLPEIDHAAYGVHGDDHSYQMRFFDLTQDLYLVQNVFECTRYRDSQTPSKLDYIFTNDDNLVEE